MPALPGILLVHSTRQRSLDRRSCVARQLERIALPVLWSEDLDACNAIVADTPQRRADLFERQDAKTWKQSMSVLELFARKVFRIVDMKNEEPFLVERLD